MKGRISRVGRYITAFLLVGVMACSFTGCGGDSNNENGSGSKVFVVGTVETPDSITATALKDFESYVENETNGAVDVQIYNNGELGSEAAILEGVELGTIQLALPGTTQFESYADKMSILDLPFLCESYDDFDKIWNSEVGKTYNQWLNEYGFTCYGYVPLGFRSVSNVKHEIRTPDDMKGLKIRVMESDNFLEMFELMGALPTTMTFNEVYTGLQQGTIDGEDNSPQYNVESGFYEIEKYYTLTRHVMSRMLYITSTEYMEGLDEGTRTAIEQGLKDCIATCTKNSIAADEEYLQQMKDNGVQVTELTDEELQAFKDCVEPMYEEFAGKEGVGSDLMNTLKAYRDGEK